MTTVKDETPEATALADAVEMIELGDAVKETKQVWPGGWYPDCVFQHGEWPGC